MIKVSLTAFMNYLNCSGAKRITAIQKAKEDSLNPFEPHKDYWYKFRQKVSSLHKTGFSEDGLRAVVDEVPEDRQKNYIVSQWMAIVSFGAREKRQNGLNHSKGIGAKVSFVFPLILKFAWNTGVKSI